MQKRVNGANGRVAIFGDLYVMVASSIFVAISIVCGKYLAINVGQILRFSFENLPIILAGISFGPLVGAVVGAASDLLGCVLVGYQINWILTLGAASVGLVSGVMYKLCRPLGDGARLTLTVLLSHIIGSVVIKTVGLHAWYSIPLYELMLWRLVNYVTVGALELTVIIIILKDKTVRRQLGIDRGIKSKSMMSYDEAISYIHSVNWTFCKPGLERVERLCHALGDPQDKLIFIHVAGTNGKGSFCAMTDSILRSAGYTVGLFTSPYIVKFNERMKINGESISDRELCELVEQIKPIVDQMEDKPTEFEMITALSFLFFAKHKCDIVVLECGLGGRLDATNIIKTPILSVITGISLDHTSILGDTVEKIAAEKAGIIKNGVPVLWCGTDDGAKTVISEKAAQVGSQIYSPDRTEISVSSMTLDGTVFSYREHKDMRLALLGGYQVYNAANVLEAVGILRSVGYVADEQAVLDGLANVVWNARFEMICHSPLVIADGGHNPEGIDVAVESIRKYFPDRRAVIITGVMADKDYKYMAERISSVAEKVFCLTPNNPRALAASEYAELFKSLGTDAEPNEDIESAVEMALSYAEQRDLPTVSLGSLYMYGDVRNAVNKHIGKK